MQFIKDGPDIPEPLLQRHEDGRVVFFCGAGISYPARLPGFAGLVKRLFKELAIEPNGVQQAAIKAGQFDTAIGLLEADLVNREIMRQTLARILSPDLTARYATATHEALLTLGKNREGRTRLITTNFDRLFETAIGSNSLEIERFQAPLLPVPKNAWDGLVYLHGLISVAPQIAELDRLVVSSGDFGLAYLTERWAARFVSELFRNYTVCFVGYSISDPVLRYMMDALAADRLRGESPQEMYAFGNYAKGKEAKAWAEWKAKSVTPILYRNHYRHAYLHRTLWSWAETYRDGVRGKERIVMDSAIARPLASTKQDDFVGRLLWALSDPQGLPAKRFAEMDPVPSLDWLVPLSEERYGIEDLVRFRVSPVESARAKGNPGDDLSFSLVRRPTPYDLAPFMALVASGAPGSRWDEVMRQLARWLIRHLNDPALFHWLVKRGDQLHDDLTWAVQRRLDELEKLQADSDVEEEGRIRAGAPNAIPNPRMRKLWDLLLSGRVRSRRRDFDPYDWCHRFRREGLTTRLRLELCEMIAPRVLLREPFRLPEGELEADGQDVQPERITDLAQWEIVLTADHVHDSLKDLTDDRRWKAALPDLLPDVERSLRDALDLMRELGGADDREDLTYISHPSISEHPQNKDFYDWTALIDLTRDAWLAMVLHAPARAQFVAITWWEIPYPLFRRLALFAAAQGEVVPRSTALEWLLSEERWWLWSMYTTREAMRLLVAVSSRLDQSELLKLEEAILTGPPRSMFKDDIEAEHWNRLVDREVWLRLAKMREGGAALSSPASNRLTELSTRHPEWQLSADQREEFVYWMDAGWVGDRDPWRTFVAIPRRRRAVLEYLVANPVLDETKQDDWKTLCRESFQSTAYALCRLSRQDVWPVDRWRDALQVWADEQFRDRSWRYMASVFLEAPDELLLGVIDSISWWLKTIAKTFEGQDKLFLALNERILALNYEDPGKTEDPVSQAINHPVGHATEALLQWWYRRPLEDRQGLPEEIASVFTRICDRSVNKYRPGRVLLAAHVLSLFRVDPDWVVDYLVPLFDWHTSREEARAAWEGFLWSPRLYRPLLEALKPAFLDTAHHYSELGKHDRQFASLLTFVALEPEDTFSRAELAAATSALPQEAFPVVAQALVSALEGAGTRSSEYWTNRVVPYLHAVWPKTREHSSPGVGESLARACVAAQGAFPDAVIRLRAWLQPVAHPDMIVRSLHRAGICSQFPGPALELLALVIGGETQWIPAELKACLEAVRSAEPSLANDARYDRLRNLLRQHGKA